jgi:hypothetical protein
MGAEHPLAALVDDQLTASSSERPTVAIGGSEKTAVGTFSSDASRGWPPKRVSARA